ncbi:sulfatase [Bacteroidota bacterium]
MITFFNLKMNRLHFLVFVWISFTACNSDLKEKGEPSRLNILWITCEDMSPRLGCYGDPIARTPNIDKLSTEGIRYTNAFSVSGVCAPSRSCLITGMYPTTTGAMHMRTMTRTSAIAMITDPELLAIPTYEAVPAPEVRCFPEYLRAAGYYCTNNSKKDYQFREPVTTWDESSDNAHWRNRKPGQPFFAVFNFTTTHESQVWSRADDPSFTKPEEVDVPPYYPDSPIVRKDIARHYDNIAIMDSQVGDILSELKEDGLMDSTIIFFYSDHGDGLPRAKRWIYDSGIKVPLIIRYPDGQFSGVTSNELVSFLDFAPTVLSLTGIEIPEYIQGKAFAGKQKTISREYIYCAHDRMDPAMENQRGVRDKRYKYIRNYMPERPYVQFLPYRDQMNLMRELLRYEREGLLNETQALWFRKIKPEEELYDTQNDPWEILNLADDPEYRDVLLKLREEHLIWKERTWDWGTMPETELIKHLWPPDGKQPSTAEPTFRTKVLDDGQVELEIISGTTGASIGYKVNDENIWQVYHKPLKLSKPEKIQAFAHRIGFKPSREVTGNL